MSISIDIDKEMEALKSHSLFRGRARIQIQVCLPPGSVAFLLQSFKKGGSCDVFLENQGGSKMGDRFPLSSQDPWRKGILETEGVADSIREERE